MAHYTHPQFYYPTPYMVPFYNQPYVSPFLPPATALPPSPQLRDERHVHFDGEPFPRQRRPSWHGGLAPPPNPVPFPSPPIIVTPLPPVMPLPTQAPAPPFTHQRSRSDTCLPQPTWVVTPAVVNQVLLQATPVVQAAPLPPAPQIHPLLNGEAAGGPKTIFDLSLYTFAPQRFSVHGKNTALTLDQLLEPATHPPVYQMTITCDLLPEWPIVLEPYSNTRERSRERSPFLSPGVSPRAAAEAPITVYDVLMAVYRTLQMRIAQTDWARLTTRQTNAVSQAYTRRSRQYPSAREFEEAQGVRRVDYLLDNYMFRGLVRANPQEGFARMRLLVGAPLK